MATGTNRSDRVGHRLRDPRSRRDFLRLAGATTVAGSATLLAACGDGGDDDDQKTTTSQESAESDVVILNAALDLEHTAVAAYAAGIPLLRGEVRRLAGRILDQERRHAEALGHTIEEIGGKPNKARSAADYRRDFPRLRSQDDVLRFAMDLENTAVAAYAGAVQRLAGPQLRQTAAAINANEAEHIAVLLGALGKPQVPGAFVTGSETT